MVDHLPAVEVVSLRLGFSADETFAGKYNLCHAVVMVLIVQLRLFGSFTGLLNMTIFLLMMILLVALMVSWQDVGWRADI
jgi:hypothetical protein